MGVLIFCIGLVFGSFLTAFTDRLHDGRDWVKSRSACDSCNKELEPRSLVPVVSWLVQKGRCLNCKKKISYRYPLIELTLGVLFLVSWLHWPYTFEGLDLVRFVLWLGTVVILAAISIYDLRWLLIPNKLIYPLLAVWVIFTAVEAIFFDGGTLLVRDSVLGLLATGGLFYFIFQISAGKWIGGGDVKLGFLLGILAGGLFEGVFLIMLASVVGLLITVPLMLAKKIAPRSQIPFGPILVLAGYGIYLFGERLVSWYTEDVLYL